MENLSRTKKILYSAIAVFVIVGVYFLTPPTQIKRTLFPLIALLGVVFLVLGAMLTIKAKREKGKLKIFLMLTGISAMTPAIAAVLHNVFYALAMTFKSLNFLLQGLSTISFILALMVGPLVFIGGAISTIVILNKKP
jgi:hypothetical protein